MGVGNLALVGSGEYTEKMLELENKLIEAGNQNKKLGPFVQFATAAGLESKESIFYWQALGNEQAKRLGVKSKFIEVFNREDALDNKWLSEIEGASLIYFSGGNPKHLAESLKGTKLWEKIIYEFSTGTSLAGCSAGAMIMGSEIAFPVIKKHEISNGLGLISKLAILPHYDRYFGKIPNLIKNLMFTRNHEINVVGIDENSALVFAESAWKSVGQGGVHLISDSPNSSFYNEDVTIQLDLSLN